MLCEADRRTPRQTFARSTDPYSPRLPDYADMRAAETIHFYVGLSVALREICLATTKQNVRDSDAELRPELGSNIVPQMAPVPVPTPGASCAW